MFNFFVILFSLIPTLTLCQTSNFNLKFNDSSVLRTGLSYPPYINVVEGHDVMFKLLKTASDQENCMLKFPNFTTINVNDKVDRIENWSEKCGVKIKKVERNDEGMWRLISQGKNGNIEALFAVLIIENTVNINENAEVTYLEDESALIHFGRNNTNYCYVSQAKASESAFIPGKCSMPTKKITRGLQGTWIVKMGVPGRMDEEQSDSKLTVEVEDVDVGYVDNINENRVHMYCNLKHSSKSMKFCRFERYRDAVGFNLADGIGKDRYSYYGEGLRKQHCGITIDRPSNEDFGNWKCSIGVSGTVDSSNTIDRILMLSKPATRIIQTKNSKIILSRLGKELKITCNANATILYCSVIHPNGTEFTPINDQVTDLAYSYDDTRLNVGECVIAFKESTYGESGMWRCQMGQTKPANIELVEVIEVRVSDAIAAVDSNIKVKLDKTTTLSCLTAEGRLLLKYCRFTTPSGTRFNIDETITYKNSILNQYYFKNDSSLYRGDCAITIKRVSSEHFGLWTCSAMIEDELTEYSNYISLENDISKMSSASVVGLSIGVVLMVIVIASVGYAVWRRRNYSNMTQNPNASADTTTGRPTLEQPIVHYANRPSSGSEESEAQVTLGLDVHRQSSYGGSGIPY